MITSGAEAFPRADDGHWISPVWSCCAGRKGNNVILTPKFDPSSEQYFGLSETEWIADLARIRSLVTGNLSVIDCPERIAESTDRRNTLLELLSG